MKSELAKFQRGFNLFQIVALSIRPTTRGSCQRQLLLSWNSWHPNFLHLEESGSLMEQSIKGKHVTFREYVFAINL